MKGERRSAGFATSNRNDDAATVRKASTTAALLEFLSWRVRAFPSGQDLVPTFEQLLLGVDNRFCMRHFYANFRKKFLGLNLKQKNGAGMIKEIQAINEKAYRHLIKICPKYWCKSRTNIERYKDDIMPRIKIRLQKKIDASRWWFPVPAGICKSEVIRGRDKFVVDLYAISAIILKKYVDGCHRRGFYVACYTPMINPCNGHMMWEQTRYPNVLPPPYKVPIGRPKKNRARGEDEVPQRPINSKVGLQQKYSYCLKLGQNKRGCPIRIKIVSRLAP
ncbi:hypothetical protein Ahy_B02g058787 isoform B [Arachis hypogaea]|uniref:Uncharacterized protein n=1 Tax=Arachis hypogaea TaxID=3818 RepID=A0A445AFE1_ARAHY|nr:hypothetical protein Ahy_B02g058787 isoform B [Arachis hypogaea]